MKNLRQTLSPNPVLAATFYCVPRHQSAEMQAHRRVNAILQKMERKKVGFPNGAANQSYTFSRRNVLGKMSLEFKLHFMLKYLGQWRGD